MQHFISKSRVRKLSLKKLDLQANHRIDVCLSFPQYRRLIFAVHVSAQKVRSSDFHRPKVRGYAIICILA